MIEPAPDPEVPANPRPPSPRPLSRRLLRIALRLAVLAGLVLAAHLLSLWVQEEMAAMSTIDQRRTVIWLLAGSLLGYALLLAIPFVPGIEVGLALLMLKGASIAPLVYLATVLGLSAAYLLGRHLPLGWLAVSFADLHLHRAAALVRRMEATRPEDRLASLSERLPHGLAQLTLRYRYLMLAALINLPGTAVIGGGGGILMMAGLSRLFRDRWALLTIALATLPIPLAVWVLGTQVLH